MHKKIPFLLQNNILLCGHRSGYLHLHSLSFDDCELFEEEGESELHDILPCHRLKMKQLYEIIVLAIFPRKSLIIL